MPIHEPHLPVSPRVELLDLQLVSAIRAAATATTASSSALHDAVCRVARDARRNEVPSEQVVSAITRRAHPYFASRPAFARYEFERQVAWWVAQEYHRDD